MSWETVTPVVDDVEQDALRQPREFEIGDRVRIRLSGECRFQFLDASIERGGAIVSNEELPDRPGHSDGEQGRAGRIAHIVGEGILANVAVREDHRYVVDYDRPMYDAEGPVHGKTYAACELELLEP